MVQQNQKISLLHRSRMEIMASILTESYAGARKTRIMYRCNLSFRQVNAYLNLLVDMKLLKPTFVRAESKEVSRLFETTEKGQAFIEAYLNLKALLVT